VPAFERGTSLATLAAVVNDEPRPMRRARQLTPMITALLSKDPAVRLTGPELRAELRRSAAAAAPSATQVLPIHRDQPPAPTTAPIPPLPVPDPPTPTPPTSQTPPAQQAPKPSVAAGSVAAGSAAAGSAAEGSAAEGSGAETPVTGSPAAGGPAAGTEAPTAESPAAAGSAPAAPTPAPAPAAEASSGQSQPTQETPAQAALPTPAAPDAEASSEEPPAAVAAPPEASPTAGETPAVEASATEAPTTEPPAVEPPAVEPPAAPDEPVAEAPAAEAPTSAPAATGPASTESHTPTPTAAERPAAREELAAEAPERPAPDGERPRPAPPPVVVAPGRHGRERLLGGLAVVLAAILIAWLATTFASREGANRSATTTTGSGAGATRSGNGGSSGTTQPPTSAQAGGQLPAGWTSFTNRAGGPYTLGIPPGWNRNTRNGSTTELDEPGDGKRQFTVRSKSVANPLPDASEDYRAYASDTFDDYRELSFDVNGQFAGRPAVVFQFESRIDGDLVHVSHINFKATRAGYNVEIHTPVGQWESSQELIKQFEQAFRPLG
jgi:eukaryotic-like serine/threonine-protein kinase